MIDTFTKYSWTLYYLGTQTDLAEMKERADLMKQRFHPRGGKRQNKKGIIKVKEVNMMRGARENDRGCWGGRKTPREEHLRGNSEKRTNPAKGSEVSISVSRNSLG